MKVLYVDDERSAHINFSSVVEQRKDVSFVKYCFDYNSALDYARENKIDCAFLDVSLGMTISESDENGIKLAQELCSLQPKIEIAFVTGYSEYTKEAYKVGGRAYIEKPYDDDEIDRVVTMMKKLVNPSEKDLTEAFDKNIHIFAKTFGNFDLIIDGVSVHFKNAKAKELLAFLVHQMSGTVNCAQVFCALWEKQEYTKVTSTYVRRTIRALKKELDLYGIGDIILSERNSIALNIKKITCDSYELMHGNELMKNQYHGEYMSQYYWGESYIPILNRIAGIEE
ncbi:MAG: response regulator [Clostridia bacterium]